MSSTSILIALCDITNIVLCTVIFSLFLFNTTPHKSDTSCNICIITQLCANISNLSGTIFFLTSETPTRDVHLCAHIANLSHKVFFLTSETPTSDIQLCANTANLSSTMFFLTSETTTRDVHLCANIAHFSGKVFFLTSESPIVGILLSKFINKNTDERINTDVDYVRCLSVKLKLGDRVAELSPEDEKPLKRSRKTNSKLNEDTAKAANLRWERFKQTCRNRSVVGAGRETTFCYHSELRSERRVATSASVLLMPRVCCYCYECIATATIVFYCYECVATGTSVLLLLPKCIATSTSVLSLLRVY
ncbi:hypothetical protein J6590_088399 [Homalodisca vitripennis]|nr:hypothetical protein J6590_088399 [Homalodisca vitripennis]